MKKYAKLIIALGLAGGIMLTGCQKNESGSAEPTEEVTPEPTEEVTPEPTAMAAEEPEPTEDPIPDGYVVSYLTGEYVPEAIGRRRPVAVMLNNLRPACPQAGIANAGVVYEAPVEGGITRLMGVFEDYDNLEKIGSVRSCRDYYIFYASGFDAIYTHYGQSAYALPFLELPEDWPDTVIRYFIVPLTENLPTTLIQVLKVSRKVSRSTATVRNTLRTSSLVMPSAA